MPTRILLIRHGQTEWNQAERFRGLADISLNETGLTQAQATAARVALALPVAVFSGPLKRALVTAQAIAEASGLHVTAVAGLNDVNYGTWQGLTIDEARQHNPDIFEQWRCSPESIRFPGGETLDEVRRRASNAIDSIATLHTDQTVAVVTHISAARLITLHLLGLPTSNFWTIMQDNCGISTFEIRNAGSVALSINDTCHLRGR